MKYPAILLTLLTLLPLPCHAADSTSLTPFDVTCPAGVDPGCHPDWQHGIDVTSGPTAAPSDGWFLYRRDSSISRTPAEQKHAFHIGEKAGALTEAWRDISRSADSGNVMVPVKKGWSYTTTNTYSQMPNKRIIFYPCLGAGTGDTPEAPVIIPAATSVPQIDFTEDSGHYTETRDVLKDSFYSYVGEGSMRIEWTPLTATEQRYISMDTSPDGRRITVTLKNDSEYVQKLREYKDDGTRDKWLTMLRYRYTDSNGNSGNGNLMVYVYGSDDMPEIKSYTHSLSEDGGTSNTKSSTNPKVSGNVLADAKPGSGTTTLSWGTSTSTYGTWKTDASGNYTYTLGNASTAVQQLGKDQTVTERLSYTWKDEAGQSASGSVTVTITGAADNPSLSKTAYSHSLTEDSGSYKASGNVLSAGYSTGDGNAVLAVTSKTGTYGSWVFSTSTGAYSYTLSNSSSAVQNLAGGQKVTDTLAFSYTDRDRCKVVTGKITITITGADEVPAYAYRYYSSGSGTFTVPAGVGKLRVTCVGGGAGGVTDGLLSTTGSVRWNGTWPAQGLTGTAYSNWSRAAGTASTFGTVTGAGATAPYAECPVTCSRTPTILIMQGYPQWSNNVGHATVKRQSQGFHNGGIYYDWDVHNGGAAVPLPNFVGTVIGHAGAGGYGDSNMGYSVGYADPLNMIFTGASGYRTISTISVTSGQKIGYSVGGGGIFFVRDSWYSTTWNTNGTGGSPGSPGAILVEWGRGIE